MSVVLEMMMIIMYFLRITRGDTQNTVFAVIEMHLRDVNLNRDLYTPRVMLRGARAPPLG